jgi:hypothetical protein
MTVHHSLTITRPAGPVGRGLPASNPPGYSFTFGGSRARMHKFGHIWFNQDPPAIKIEIEIVSQDFFFQHDPSNPTDGSLALYTSDDPASKTMFKAFGGEFGAPTLDLAWKKLTFTSANTNGKFYYYQLNVLDQARSVVVTWDPIIVNQP